MKILFFYDDTFPYEGARPTEQVLKEASTWAEISDADTLSDRLTEGGWDALVHLHGPYFPKQAWKSVKLHLECGGGLVHTGGVPFRKPVVKNGDTWKVEREQIAYHQQLNIHDALPVDVAKVERLVASSEFAVMEGSESLFGIEPTWGLTLHPSKSSDIPSEMGSCGPMDAHIYPLLTAVDRDGRERAAPTVLIENTKGDFAGGRWVLVNQTLQALFWSGRGLALLEELAEFAGRGVTELWIKPSYAVYEAGEQPQLVLQLQTLSRPSRVNQNWTFELSIGMEDQTPV